MYLLFRYMKKSTSWLITFLQILPRRQILSERRRDYLMDPAGSRATRPGP